MTTSMPIINYNGATAEIFEFCSKTNQREYHVIIHATNPLDTFQEQYLAVRTAAMLVQKEHLADAQPVMKLVRNIMTRWAAWSAKQDCTS